MIKIKASKLLTGNENVREQIKISRERNLRFSKLNLIAKRGKTWVIPHYFRHLIENCFVIMKFIPFRTANSHDIERKFKQAMANGIELEYSPTSLTIKTEISMYIE